MPLSRRRRPGQSGLHPHAAAMPPRQTASAAASVSSPPVVIPAGYSLDRGEGEIRSLQSEAQQLKRRATRGEERPTDRMRAQEIEEEVKQKQAVLLAYRRQSRDVAISALGVLLLVALVWVLLGWESPLAWMEALNKERRHSDMMKATGGAPYAQY